MPMNIIQGAIGAGKGALCLDQIERLHSLKPDARCIMIVPDHYSYDTEKRFVEHFGGTGLNNIEVLTLRQMVINYLKASELKYITDTGRQMLIYKAVKNFCNKAERSGKYDPRLIASMRKSGFLDVAGSLISEMKRYAVKPESLLSGAGGENETLRQKLEAFSEIYAAYSKFIKESGCVDSEDNLDKLAEFIRSSDEFNENMYVWFDKFDEFMPHQLRVIKAMLERKANVTLSVTDAGFDGEKTGAMKAAEELARGFGLNKSYALSGALKHIKNPELMFLFKNWNSLKAKYNKETRGITLFESRDAYGEIERAACQILSLVREEGYRFRDIALLCGNEEEYRHLIETIFEEYDIPYFTDSTMLLSDHPIAVQVLALFDILSGDWQYEKVFEYLRAGFIYEEADGKTVPLDQGDVDELENYVLRYGIRGRKRWCRDQSWKKENDIINSAFGTDAEEEENDAIENLRQKIIGPIERYRQATSKMCTAEEHARALYEYFEEIHLYDGLNEDIKTLQEEGDLNEARQFAQLWQRLLNVLNQTVVSVGQEKMYRAQYADYIRAGLSKCEIRIIPSGIDQVYIGNVERSSQADVRAMFVIGAVGGTFPSDIPSEGFLSNSDRNTLEKNGIHIAPDTKRKAEQQYFKVYKALCAATENLFLSYPIQTSEGKALRPARMITDIRRLFPDMVVKDNLIDENNNSIYISSPEATIHRMLVAKSKNNPNRVNSIWEAAYKWYENSGEWGNMLSLIDRAEEFVRLDISLNDELAKKLYSGIKAYSASQLNAFASCPYGYFAKYGLNAKSSVEWEINPSNAGEYAHRVICEFVERVEEGTVSAEEKLERWRNLAEEKTDETIVTRDDIINDIVERTCKNILASNQRGKERTASIFRRMGKTISGAAGVIHKSLRNGRYTEDGLERDFRIVCGKTCLEGRIDRVDVYKPENGDVRVRVIDYKTGGTSFDVEDIFNGLNMQPVIYAIAAKALMRDEFGGEPMVTGIYYNKIRDDLKRLAVTDSEEKSAGRAGKNSRLDGVTFIENDGSRGVIDEMDDIGDNENSYLNIYLKKDGSIKSVNAVKTQAEIEGLIGYVKDAATDIDSAIRSGRISPRPYKYRTDKSPCEDCDYNRMCNFFGDKTEPRVKAGKKDEIWEEMAKRGEFGDDEVD